LGVVRRIAQDRQHPAVVGTLLMRVAVHQHPGEGREHLP
jgi:hypothetical protein